MPLVLNRIDAETRRRRGFMREPLCGLAPLRLIFLTQRSFDAVGFEPQRRRDAETQRVYAGTSWRLGAFAVNFLTQRSFDAVVFEPQRRRGFMREPLYGMTLLWVIFLELGSFDAVGFEPH